MTLNDRTSPLSLLHSRRSGKARDLVGPGPNPDQLRKILSIASRTPDHGKLAPWRFVVVGADQREQLAALLEEALAIFDPEASPAHYLKAREFALQAPTLVVMISSPVHGHKIPLWEQQLSAGAAGMNLLHAAHALGFVGSWITGWAAYSERVAASFCAEGERIAGFFFLGTPASPLEDRPRPDLDQVVRNWMPFKD